MPSRKHASSALMSMKSLQNDKHTGALRSRGCEDQVQRAGAKEQARGMEICSNKRCAFKHIASASPLGCSKIEIAGSDLVLISEGIDKGIKLIPNANIHLPLLVIRVPRVFWIELEEQVDLGGCYLEDGLPINLGQVNTMSLVICTCCSDLSGPGSADIPDDLNFLGEGQTTVKKRITEGDDGAAVFLLGQGPFCTVILVVIQHQVALELWRFGPYGSDSEATQIVFDIGLEVFAVEVVKLILVVLVATHILILIVKLDECAVASCTC
mmetsp:Transcript_104545/g.248829  ORF Transcript_104545/g.248829 Transcript_104545/m.248829 type:complete len:268 (-) Transcript_104545:3232-4035(-)